MAWSKESMCVLTKSCTAPHWLCLSTPKLPSVRFFKLGATATSSHASESSMLVYHTCELSPEVPITEAQSCKSLFRTVVCVSIFRTTKSIRKNIIMIIECGETPYLFGNCNFQVPVANHFCAVCPNVTAVHASLPLTEAETVLRFWNCVSTHCLF